MRMGGNRVRITGIRPERNQRYRRLVLCGIVVLGFIVTVIYYNQGNWYFLFQVTNCETFGSATPLMNSSTCSESASKRGPHQKVVSFSLYGVSSDHGLYFQGVEANCKLVEKFYPGWVVRVYHDIPRSKAKTMKILEDFQKRFTNLDLCSAYDISGYGDVHGSQQNMWRFLPIADPLVDLFISRDLDSRISERELSAVNEWLKSNLSYHVMRDHPYHKDDILAGMWGVQVARVRQAATFLLSRMLLRGSRRGNKYLDQDLLKEIVWPAIKWVVMQHDSYHCETFSSHGNMRPWPTRRLNESYNFVGSAVPSNYVKGMYTVCPLACRPPDHKDWTTC